MSVVFNQPPCTETSISHTSSGLSCSFLGHPHSHPSHEAGVHPASVSGAGVHRDGTAGPDMSCLQSVWMRDRHPNLSEGRESTGKDTHIHMCICVYTGMQERHANSCMGMQTHAIHMHARMHAHVHCETPGSVTTCTAPIHLEPNSFSTFQGEVNSEAQAQPLKVT